MSELLARLPRLMDFSPDAVCKLNGLAATVFGLVCVLFPPVSLSLYFDEEQPSKITTPLIRCIVTLLGVCELQAAAIFLTVKPSRLFMLATVCNQLLFAIMFAAPLFVPDYLKFNRTQSILFTAIDVGTAVLAYRALSHPSLLERVERAGVLQQKDADTTAMSATTAASATPEPSPDQPERLAQ